MLIDDGTGGLSRDVIGVAIEIHKEFGSGLLEHAYHLPMVWALERRGFKVEFERPLSIEFDGKIIERAYIVDMIVENKVLIEIKSVAAFLPVHFAQVKTYLKLSGVPVGLLMNFNVPVMKDGIKRVCNPDVER
jgi:GxxExxY protein